jgi:hypothetical protein
MERRRTRWIRAGGLGAVALLVAGCGAAGQSAAPVAATPPPAALESAGATAATPPTTTPQATQLPEAATIVDQIDYAGDGEVIWQQGVLWVEDRDGQVLSQVDTANLSIVRRVGGVLGGYMTYQDGIVWMSSFVLDSLLRIDPRTGEVRQLDLGPGQAGTTGVIGTSRGVWAANHYLGTIVRVDDKGKVVESVQVSRAGIMGPQAMTTDGENIWVTIPEDQAVAKVRISDGAVLAHVAVDYVPSGAMAFGDGRIWVTGGGEDAKGRVTEIDAERATATRVLQIGHDNGRALYAFGSLWVPLLDGSRQLLRVDPDTGHATGQVILPADGIAVAASEGFLFVRIVGGLLKLEPR